MAPSGYLLIDDMDLQDVELNNADVQLKNAPGIKKSFGTMIKLMQSKDQDPWIGPKIGPWLEAMAEFEEVKVDSVNSPCSPVPVGKLALIPYVLSSFSTLTSSVSPLQIMSSELCMKS